MGDRDEIGVSTGEAARAAVNAATAAEQYEVIDLDFRSVITGVSDAVVEPPVVTGVSMFCETHGYDLVRLRAHMQTSVRAPQQEGRPEAGPIVATPNDSSRGRSELVPSAARIWLVSGSRHVA